MALVPFDQREGKIIINGEMVDWKDAKVHVLSHVLHYGSGVFEGERAYNGRIFKGREHSERLIKSAKLIDMASSFTAEQLDAAKDDVMKANNLSDAYIRAFAWRGSEQMGISAQDTKTHWAVAAWEWPSYFSPEQREQGLKLKTSSWRRPSPECAPVHAKAAGLYMICTMSKHQAESEGYHDAMMLDYRGYVAEATGANLFFIKDGKVATPTPDCFLNGITRQTVIDLMAEMGIECEERHIKPEELGDFEEAFLTGTAAEVTAIGAIDDNKYVVGDTVKAIRERYENLVRGENAEAKVAAG